VLRGFTPTGTPEEVVAALRSPIDTFADERDVHLVVRLHYPGMGLEDAAAAVELFAAEVIPALRR
jgi:hypothetical protein